MNCKIREVLLIYLALSCCSFDRLGVRANSDSDNVLPEGPQSRDAISNVILEDDASIGDETSPRKVPIKRDDYTLETHTVTTSDGYVLTLKRIPGPAGSVPVLLQHGLLGCSEQWLLAGEGKSFAHILSDHGYDVWLGNIRGSTLSKKHRTLSTSDPEFWNFTWHELGVYDLPAMITYVTQLKNDSLFYVGHSMGATTFSVMAIERPDVAQKVKAMIGLAPATYVHHMRSPLKIMSFSWNIFQRVSHALGIYEFFPRSYFFDAFSEYICESSLLRNVVCSNPLFLICGFNSEQLDYDLLPKIWSTFPAGTSIKLYTHWLQQISTNEFRKFDYGEEDNLRIYNSSVPPNYDLTKIKVPAAIFYSENDWLVGEEDVHHYYEQLNSKLHIHKVEDSLFNHFDFLFAKNAPQVLYKYILDVMTDYQNQIVKK